MSSKPVGFSQVTAIRANNGKDTRIPAPFGGIGQTAAAAREQTGGGAGLGGRI